MILVTGSKGLLGTELKKHLDFVGIDRSDCDITDETQVKRILESYKPEIVLHLAAYTNVGMADKEKEACYKTNVVGTANLAKYSKYLIYISTEYVFDGMEGNYKEEDIPNPINFYSLTKLLGEFEAKKATRYAILRVLFKPKPFKHALVCEDMWTSGRYVDEMAAEIAKAVKIADHLPPILHIGFKKINLFELARQTRADVQPTRRVYIKTKLPGDTSLDISLWTKLKTQYNLG